MTSVDTRMVTDLTRAVQRRLEADATQRAERGQPPLLSRPAQEALAIEVLRNEFQRIDERRLAEGAARLTAEDEDELTDRVIALAVGLGPVELLLANADVEEIVGTRHDLVFVYRSDGSVELLEDRLWRSEAELSAWLSHLARTAGRTERQFNAQTPMLVMRLGEGLRLAATRDVSQHVSFALRRNTLGKVTIADLVGRRMLPHGVAEMLRACMRSTEIRVVFSGPTGSGKSTMVRAALSELDPMARVVIIEDTAELDLFDPALHPNVESWEERLANNEGEGAISQGQAVKHALRYRPDWLVCGEVRDSDAAVPMLKAMTHGQSSLTTVHAPTALGALDKLALYLGTGEDRLAIDVAHHQLFQAVDFVVHLDRSPDGRRVVTEVIEIAGFDGARCTTNTIYTLDADVERTRQRLTQHHLAKLRRAGFDEQLLSSGGEWS